MDNWQRTLLSHSDPIEKAIKVINNASLQIALVCDESRRLLGTVTDGDIRRALIRDCSMETPVSAIMCSEPVTATREDSLPRIAALMRTNSVDQVPVLQGPYVVDLYTRKSLEFAKRKPNPVFLMAGGFGTRLRPLTDDCPKPLLKVGDKPILETILESFIEHGFYRFFISTHYLHEKITDYFGNGERWGVEIQYVHEENPLGTAGALSLLPEDIEHPILMMNGDLLTKVNFSQLLSFHEENAATATMCVRREEYQIPYGVIQSNDGQIANIVEKPVQSFFINAGIYVISPELRRQVVADQKTDMPDLLQSQINGHEKVSLFPIHEYWLDIGKMPDFNRAQQDFLSDFTAREMSA